jgi:hypothetical protein
MEVGTIQGIPGGPDQVGASGCLIELRANAAAVVIKEIARAEQSKGEGVSGGLFPADIKKMKIDLSRWRNA